MPNMHDPDQWRSESALIGHLASELVRGRLGLLLGAGVSTFYGLPDWRTLVNRVCHNLGEPPLSPADDPITRIGGIRVRHFERNEIGYLDAVRAALYQGK